MDQFEQFAQAIRTANGLGTGNMYRDYATAGVVNASPAANAGREASVQARNDEITRQNAEAEAKITAQRDQDSKDPNKAQMVQLPENQGYAFFDGTGNRISINKYAMLTGKRPDQLLADSPNPQDQKFVQDYQTMTAFTNAWVNGDRATLAKMRSADPEKFNQLISQHKSPGDMVKAFTQHWSDYYNPGGGQAQSTATSSFAPQALYSPDKAAQKQLDTTTLPQVLTPSAVAPPPQLNFLQTVNPFSGARDARNRYNKYLEQNPWFSYQNKIMGL